MKRKGRKPTEKPRRARRSAAKIKPVARRLQKYRRAVERLKKRYSSLEALARGQKPFAAARAYIENGGLRNSPAKLFYAVCGCPKERLEKMSPAERQFVEKCQECAWLSEAAAPSLAHVDLVCETLVRLATDGLAPLESDRGVADRIVIAATRAYWRRRQRNAAR